MDGEYVTADAYRLLRRLVAVGPQRMPSRTPDDEAAAGFLVTRGLAVWTDDERLEVTMAGRDIGRITRAAP